MRRLILQTGVSVDGFVAGLDGSHDWGYEGEDEATKRWKLESVSKAGTHLMGRVTYHGANLDRLRQLQAVYDPGGVLSAKERL